MGYDQHWNFGVQQQFASDLVVDLEYVGNKGTNIQRNNALNIRDPGAGSVHLSGLAGESRILDRCRWR